MENNLVYKGVTPMNLIISMNTSDAENEISYIMTKYSLVQANIYVPGPDTAITVFVNNILVIGYQGCQVYTWHGFRVRKKMM